MSKNKTCEGIGLILGDHLNLDHTWFADPDWLYVMMEIKAESEYVTHHIQKIVGVFQAMRVFAGELRARGLDVTYFQINDENNLHSFEKNLQSPLEANSLDIFPYQEPDEWRLDQILRK